MPPTATSRLGLGRLGLGAANLGNLYRPMSDAEASAIVDRAWELGVRSFDTAPHYGLGLSERRLGAALAARPRDGYVLSTKVGRLLVPRDARPGELDDANDFVVPAAFERVWDPTADGVRRSLEDSLRRLGTDRIDIAYLHDPEEYDLGAGIGTALPALAALRSEGLLRGIGVGSKSVAALSAAVRTGLCDVIMVAGRLTLLDDRGAELPGLCAEHGVEIVNAGVLNSGALAGGRPGPDLRFEYAPIDPERLRALRRIHEICDAFGVPVVDAAVQYALRVPGVVNVTVGASRPEHVEMSARGSTRPIDPALWSALAAARNTPR